MSENITVEMVKAMAAEARSRQIRPAVVESKQTAARLMRADRAIGLSRKWSVGDEYWLVHTSDGIRVANEA